MAKARVEMIINGQQFKAAGEAGEVMRQAEQFLQQQLPKAIKVKKCTPTKKPR